MAGRRVRRGVGHDGGTKAMSNRKDGTYSQEFVRERMVRVRVDSAAHRE